MAPKMKRASRGVLKKKGAVKVVWATRLSLILAVVLAVVSMYQSDLVKNLLLIAAGVLAAFGIWQQWRLRLMGVVAMAAVVAATVGAVLLTPKIQKDLCPPTGVEPFASETLSVVSSPVPFSRNFSTRARAARFSVEDSSVRYSDLADSSHAWLVFAPQQNWVCQPALSTAHFSRGTHGAAKVKVTYYR